MKRFLYSLLVFLVIFSGCRTPDKSTDGSTSDIIGAGTIASTKAVALKSSVNLEPYNSYFLSLKAFNAGLFLTAEKLAKSSLEISSGLIDIKASELYCKIIMEQEKYSEAENFANLYILKYPDNHFYKKIFAESVFNQGDDKKLLAFVKKYKNLPEIKNDNKLLLYKTIAEYRINNQTDSKPIWENFLLNCPANDVFIKGWEYIEVEDSRIFDDFQDVGLLIKAKYELAKKNYNISANAFFEFLSNNAAEYLTVSMLNDCETAFMRSGKNVKGARTLQAVSEKTNNFYAMFTAARLFRRSAYYKNAEKCLDNIKNNFQKDIGDRVLWYMLDIKIKRQPENVLDELDYFFEHWNNPYYFKDILENLCTELVSRENWAEINNLAQKLHGVGPVETIERCYFILEEAANLEYFPSQNYENTYSNDYYSFLSGKNPYEEIMKERVELSYKDKQMNEAETFIYKMLVYEIDGIVEEISILSSQISEWFFIYCADILAERENYLDSIRLMYRFDGELSKAGLMRLYPDAYKNLIIKYSKEKNIPPQLLSAIVWKESAFEKDIVSFSGAVGLSQLMPSTADDVATRMNVTVKNLTDPDENLLYGSWYLDWLKGYVGNTALSVLSYNGGPGRITRWKTEYPDFSDKLFYESLPIQETHLYGKRVLVAACIYGMLYYDIEPADTVKIFF